MTLEEAQEKILQLEEMLTELKNNNEVMTNLINEKDERVKSLEEYNQKLFFVQEHIAELIQLLLHTLLRNEYSLILGYHGGTHASAHSILNYYTVGFGTEDNAYRRILVGTFYIAVKCFQVKFQLPKVAWMKLGFLQLDSYQGLQSTMVKQ